MQRIVLQKTNGLPVITSPNGGVVPPLQWLNGCNDYEIMRRSAIGAQQ